MGIEEFSTSMTNRSIRTIKTELEFLADNSIITQQQLSSMLRELPSETSISSGGLRNGMNGLSLNNNNHNHSTSSPAINEKQAQSNYYDSQPVQQQQPPPPAYNTPSPAVHSAPPPPPPPAAPAPLTYAVSMYPYNATDAGDLNLQANDRVAVTEYMNAEWWKGRNERTGQEGIFPRSYVRVEEKGMQMGQHTPVPPPQSSGYGNMPVEVAQGGQQQQQQQGQDGKVKGTAQKIGGKLGNAAIFGAGATIGSNLVNSIF